MDAILKLAKDTNLQAYIQDDGDHMPESIHLAKTARSAHCCCTSHHQFCLEGPEPRMLYPGCLNQEEHKNLTHMAWTPEDEALDCGIDKQQQRANDVFMDNIVALGMSLSFFRQKQTLFMAKERVKKKIMEFSIFTEL